MDAPWKRRKNLTSVVSRLEKKEIKGDPLSFFFPYKFRKSVSKWQFTPNKNMPLIAWLSFNISFRRTRRKLNGVKSAGCWPYSFVTRCLLHQTDPRRSWYINQDQKNVKLRDPHGGSEKHFARQEEYQVDCQTWWCIGVWKCKTKFQCSWRESSWQEEIENEVRELLRNQDTQDNKDFIKTFFPCEARRQ